MGAFPALLPYFAAERGYDYTAVGGVLLAGTLLSCVVQPAFGVLSDRYRLWWMVPGGMALAGLGVGLAGVFDSYLLVCVSVALSGVGVSAYHPEAAKTARAVARESTGGMSVFSVGGNVGLALGPFVVAGVISLTGMRGTILLAAPAVVMAVVYVAARPRRRPAAETPVRPAAGGSSPGAGGGRARADAGTDDWRSFRILVAVIVARAIGSVGTGSFIALYLVAEFDRSASEGSLALGVFSGFGVLGTLFGGWLADRIGRVAALRTAYVVAPVAMAGVILLPSYPLGLAAAALVGFAWYMPFAVQLVLGQDYLPSRQGTASGVTLGFSITAAGLFTPILGSVADARGLDVALWIGAAALLAALGLALSLPGTRMKRPDDDNAIKTMNSAQ
nr:MFS transporter [Nocardioides humi]